MAAFLSSSALLLSFSNLNAYSCGSPLVGFWFFLSSSLLSLLNSASYFLRRALWSISSLILASFLIFLALVANLRVDWVSPKASEEGEIIAIIVVLQLPPRLSSRILVSFESLYGICDLDFLSVKAAMTFPSALRLWLMLLLSSSLWPVAYVTLTRSLPARSTRLSFPTLICLGGSYPSFSLWLLKMVICSNIIINTAWDLELKSFILVEAVALHWAPFYISEYTSFGDLTAHSLSPSTKTPFFLSSLI